MAHAAANTLADLLFLACCCYLCQQATRPRVVVVQREVAAGAEAASEDDASDATGVAALVMQREGLEILASNGASLPLLSLHGSK